MPESGSVRPILKWAGGKRQLLRHLRPFYPDHIEAYFEPFLGSGAVFFDLWSLGRLRRARVLLTDQNADLIGCYLRLRDSIDEVIAAVRGLADGHARGGQEHYYDVRDARFNPARHAWQAAGGRAEGYSSELAAMLIYLNRTGYNGLFRQNSRGGFNVPAGRYESPRIIDEPLLRTVSAVLGTPLVEIAERPFEEAVIGACAGDLVYFDPPYAPLSATAHFRAYTAAGFTDGDQARLQETAIALARRGVGVLLSNSTADSICRLYQSDERAQAAGLRAYRFAARRAINSRSDRRGAIDELVVTNRTPQKQPDADTKRKPSTTGAR
jgi:DNA adenine methylase